MGWPVCCYAIKLKLLFALSVEIALGLADFCFVVVVSERDDVGQANSDVTSRECR